MATGLHIDQLKKYHNDGYLVLKNYFSHAEVEKLYSTATADQSIKQNALDLKDQEGKKTKLSLWFTPGNDVFGYYLQAKCYDGQIFTKRGNVTLLKP